MSYLRKIERQRPIDRAREAARLKKKRKHEAKLAARKPQRVLEPKLPDFKGIPADLVHLNQPKAPEVTRRPGMIRKLLRQFGSIFTTRWEEQEKMKDLLAADAAKAKIAKDAEAMRGKRRE